MARTKRGVVSRAKHNKVFKNCKKAKEEEERIRFVLLVRQWKRQCNTLTETEKQKKRIQVIMDPKN